MLKSIALTVLKYLAIYAVVGVIGIGFMLWRSYRQRQQRLGTCNGAKLGDPQELNPATPRAVSSPAIALAGD